MAKKNLQETVKQVPFETIPPEYQIDPYQIMELKADAWKGTEDAIAAIMKAFQYGYIMGHRATQAGKYKEVRGAGKE